MASFALAPWASVFIHWLVGMVYVFYFASFVILLREVLRPGVLWFLRCHHRQHHLLLTSSSPPPLHHHLTITSSPPP